MGWQMSDINVSVKAVLDADGNVIADVDCNGQQAEITFTGTDVFVKVPELPQAAQ